jgi:hypothetical protein
VQLGIPLSVVTSVRRAQALPPKWPMPILDEITQPDRQGWGEVLNRNDHHTLDAKDHEGSTSHLGQSRHFGCVQVTSGLLPTPDMPL